MAFINLRHARQWVAWMQIKRHIKIGYHIPKRGILGQIVIDSRFLGIDLRKAVDQGTDKAQFLDASLHFSACHVDILKR